MKKRLFGVMLSLALMLTMIPVLGMTQTAFAGDTTSTAALTIDANTTEDIGNLEKDHYHYDASENILTLNNYVYSGDADIGIELVNVTTDFTIELEGSNSITSTATEGSGIQCISYNNKLTIKGTGRLTASGSDGIFTPFCHTVISSGTVIATGSGNGSYGINAWYGDVTISGGKITAIGDGAGISGNVINTITGTGWTDTAGTTGIADINTSEAGQELSAYKKVVFPAAEKYPLWVGGVQVNSANASNITGGDTVTASYDSKSNTLTLNNYNYSGPGTSTLSGHYAAIYNGVSNKDFTVELIGENNLEIASGGDYDYGILHDKHAYTVAFTGNGSLNVKCGPANEENYGISSLGNVVIDGPSLDIDAGSNGIGIFCTNYKSVDIKSGSLTAKGSRGAIILNGDSTTMKNHIDGLGWTDMGGTAGKTYIDVSTEGQKLSKNIKKVIFPAPLATVTTIPAAKSLTYSGSAQALVTAGTAKGGTMQYALGNDDKTEPMEGWSTSIPKGSESGTYYVWYKAVGDNSHVDSDAACVTVTIAKNPEPTPVVSNGPIVKTTASASAGTMTVKWSWNKVIGAKKYKVAYRKVGSKKWKVKKTKKTKYVIKGQKIRGLYEYKVAAVTSTGDVWSNVSYRYFKNVRAKATAGKGIVTVKWKKDKGATGYEVLIAANKKMKNAQKISVASSEKAYTISGLEKGKYYVKVRPVKTRNGVTYKGILSRIQTVKVK